MKDLRLTPKQYKFCKLYVTAEDFFGNGVRAYIEAYNVNPDHPGAYESAKTNASRLLTNVNILTRIGSLLESEGLNDAYVDKQLYFLIAQNQDFGAKLRAIQEYNRLRQRYKDKVEVDGNLSVNVSNYKKYLKENTKMLSGDQLTRLAIEQIEEEKQNKKY